VEDLSISYWVSDTTDTFDILQTLTGLERPAADHAWNFQYNTVWSGGETFTAAVDVQTGALIYYMEISGSTLAGIF